MSQQTGNHMNEKKLHRLLRDAEKLKNPEYMKKLNRRNAPASGMLCNKCFYKKFCGEYNESITCEAYRPLNRKPKFNDRNGRK